MQSFGDDKYAKYALASKKLDVESGPFSGVHCSSSLNSLSLGSITKHDVSALFRNAFLVYTVFLMAGSFFYHALGGSFRDMDLYSLLGYISSIAEAFGLLMLRRKIQRQESVCGISGRSVKMYVLVYTIRGLLQFPAFSVLALDDWAVKALELAALVMVADVCYSVFVSYRSSYEEELDVLKLRYLIPSCVVLGLLIRPDLRQDLLPTLGWTMTLYLDVMALMPQVVMMSRGGGKVEAPISHFVAATAVSRSVDLSFWYYAFDTVGPENSDAYLNYSGWLIVFFHVLHLLLIADFLYYYVRARFFKGCGFSGDMNIPLDGEDMI